MGSAGSANGSCELIFGLPFLSALLACLMLRPRLADRPPIQGLTDIAHFRPEIDPAIGAADTPLRGAVVFIFDHVSDHPTAKLQQP